MALVGNLFEATTAVRQVPLGFPAASNLGPC